jgi:hypothetical protein
MFSGVFLLGNVEHIIIIKVIVTVIIIIIITIIGNVIKTTGCGVVRVTDN